jgi:branched-chain amino acid transport system ATP-binding protein
MMLKIENLHAYYGKSHILHGVDMVAEAGEIVAVVGRNGVGRSTLMKAIMGSVETTGEIVFGGRNIARLPTYEIARRGIGYVAETREIFANLTVRENLVLGMRSRGSENYWSEQSVFERFPNLEKRADTDAGRLSGGEQQMLAISRALMGQPRLLIVDEPTEGLAPRIVEQIAVLLRFVRSLGITVILVEQKLDIALDISDRAYVMGRGRMVFEGAPQELHRSNDIISEWLKV